MKSVWEKEGSYKGKLKVTLEKEEWSKACDKAFKKIGSKVELSGFRKGQVPESLLRKKISAQEIYYEACEEMANEGLRFGLDKEGIELVARPTFDIESVTEDSAVLVYDCTVSPDVKLGEYKGLEYDKVSTRVTAAEVKTELEKIQKQYTEQVTKEEGDVEKGDIAEIDFEGFLDGEAFEGGKGENYPLEIGSGSFIPGFEDQIIGMKTGEEKDINVTFPKEYGSENLAGKDAVFKVKVNAVKQNVLPELNDDLAKDLDEEGIETLKDLENKIKSNLKEAKEENAKATAEDELLKKVVENMEVELPVEMVESEKDWMFANFKQRMSAQGLPFESYVQFSGKTEAELREEIGASAEERIKSRLALKEIARQEKIEVTEEDLDKEYEQMALQYRIDKEDIKKYVDPEELKEDVSLQKALAFVFDNAKAAKKTKEKEEKSE